MRLVAFRKRLDYVLHMKGIKMLHEREFERRYGFSSLKYFHRELGIK